MFSTALRRIGGKSASQLLKVPSTVGATRLLNVHEYASMEIFRKYGVPVPNGGVANNLAEVEQVYKDKIGEGKDCVIKAMVLAGGRGLGTFDNGFKGGVHLCTEKGQLENAAKHMLGANLITKQTLAEGMPCNKVMLVQRMTMKREMYVSIMLDRASNGPVFIASPCGGTSIEDVAAATPEKIFKQPINIVEGMTDKQSEFLATSLGFAEGTPGHTECQSVMKNLYKLFCENDCTLVEVNPLAETNEGNVMVCDGKLNFDDNAEYRQKEVFDYRDRSQEDPREVEASKYDLNYIGLNGSIGCMVNGAGLAMSTMDIISVSVTV